MKLTNPSQVPVYTVSGSSTARPLPEWLARKRKRSLKADPEFANRVELLQDFEFEEASQCIRISEDGDWVMSTGTSTCLARARLSPRSIYSPTDSRSIGTYKPQIHVHHTPHLSLSYARHTDALNTKFELLSSDYSKSLHLQADRTLQFHTPQGCHYTTRIPRYGRDLQYSRHAAEALIPAVGVDGDGMGEVYRLNLELGRYLKSYSVDVGGDDLTSAGAGALQGGIRTGAVNVASIAEDSHNLLAFGTSIGTVEFWDPRARARAALLPASASTRPEITALAYGKNGLAFATGDSTGLIHLYDLRSPLPLLKKDQGYGFPIQNLLFLDSSANTAPSEPKVMSADKRIIKLWDQQTGAPWTSMEPAVDLHDVQWVRDSGMFLTANEGRQQHSFFLPTLGPAPKWCAFLDNLVEEMAEDAADPLHFASSGARQAGDVYDNFRFVSLPELSSLGLDHLVGKTGLLRPYMHGFFVAQQLYEEARLIAQPDAWAAQRQKAVRERIDKERASRIRGAGKKVKVNAALARRLEEREEKNERRKARRLLQKSGADDAAPPAADDTAAPPAPRPTLLTDPRFAALFQDDDFAVDEHSAEFRMLNPATRPAPPSPPPRTSPRGLTTAQAQDLSDPAASSDSDSDSDSDPAPATKQQQKHRRPAAPSTAFSSASYHHPKRRDVRMAVSSSAQRPRDAEQRGVAFGARAAALPARTRAARREGTVVGPRSVTWEVGGGKKGAAVKEARDGGRRDGERRSGGKNRFRGL